MVHSWRRIDRVFVRPEETTLKSLHSTGMAMVPRALARGECAPTAVVPRPFALYGTAIFGDAAQVYALMWPVLNASRDAFHLDWHYFQNSHHLFAVAVAR
jgi:hypothetical protein